MWSKQASRVPRGLTALARLQSLGNGSQTVRCMGTRAVYQQRSARSCTGVARQQVACMSSTSTTDHGNQSRFNASVAALLAGAGVSLSALLLWREKSRVHCEAAAEAPTDSSPASDSEGAAGKGTDESGQATGDTSVEPDIDSLPDIPRHAPYLLIGAGTASISAVRGIWNKDAKAQILIVGDESRNPYKRPPLSKEFWYKEGEHVKALESESLFHMPTKFYCSPRDLPLCQNGGVAVLSGRKVVKLDAVGKRVYLEDGTEITYNKCLIATGGKPRNLPLFEKADEEVKKRTTLYRNVADFKKLNELSDKAKSIAVIGGGFLGSELACGLGHKGQKTGMKVYQIFPEPGNLGRVLPEYLSVWASQFVRKEGVETIPGQTVSSVAFIKKDSDDDKDNTEKGDKDSGNDSHIELTLTDGTSIQVDHVVVAVGLEPNTELAKTSMLEVHDGYGGYMVNSELEARSGVWAAGDAACYYDVKLGRRRVEHHVHAVSSGKLAGENMTGAAKPYTYQSMFWSDLGPNLGFEAVGFIDGSLATTAIFARGSDFGQSETSTDMEAEPVTSDGEKSDTPPTESQGSENYGRGIIFYKRDDVVVGVLLWNVYNHVNKARKLIMMNASDDKDLAEAAKLFKIH